MAPGRTEEPANEPLAPRAAEDSGATESKIQIKKPNFPRPPKFEDKYEEREYLKGRLAAAFRIFGKFGFDEGVAGHITLRVSKHATCHWCR